MAEKTLNVGIYGVGLIGGSLGMALKCFNRKSVSLKYRVFGIGRNLSRLKKARKLGAVDCYTIHPETILDRLDLIVLAVRIDLISDFARKIIPGMKDGSVITDVGSVKGTVYNKVNKILKNAGRKIYFIPGHPIAGSEKSGVQNANNRLFEGSYCVLSKCASVPAVKHSMIKNLWIDAGARVLEITPQRHDKILSVTSHLPHVISMALLLIAGNKFRNNPEAVKLSAGSFRDITRISDSDPESWSRICRANKIELLGSLDLFEAYLKKIKNNLRKDISIKKYFFRARDFRRKCFSSPE